mmetsp:Transcript_31413/g.65689  ORF Transcript_31413/g.65689 Transcript_31413/m.65689 type:complete len:221 (+) Transcript_31413:415-1077(+)
MVRRLFGRHALARVQLQHHGEDQGLRGAFRLHPVCGGAPHAALLFDQFRRHDHQVLGLGQGLRLHAAVRGAFSLRHDGQVQSQRHQYLRLGVVGSLHQGLGVGIAGAALHLGRTREGGQLRGLLSLGGQTLHSLGGRRSHRQDLGLSDQIHRALSRWALSQYLRGVVSSETPPHLFGVGGWNRSVVAEHHLPGRDDVELWNGACMGPGGDAGDYQTCHWF